MALAVAGLVPDLAATMPHVPFLCHVQRALGITDADPYGEIVRYLAVHRLAVDNMLRTLSYVDGVVFAPESASSGVVRCGAARHRVSAVDRVRRLQRLRRGQGDRGVSVQPPRGRGRVPHATSDRVARGRRPNAVGGARGRLLVCLWTSFPCGSGRPIVWAGCRPDPWRQARARLRRPARGALRHRQPRTDLTTSACGLLPTSSAHG